VEVSAGLTALQARFPGRLEPDIMVSLEKPVNQSPLAICTRPEREAKS
jgi:hypothetical protein